MSCTSQLRQDGSNMYATPQASPHMLRYGVCSPHTLHINGQLNPRVEILVSFLDRNHNMRCVPFQITIAMVITQSSVVYVHNFHIRKHQLKQTVPKVSFVGASHNFTTEVSASSSKILEVYIPIRRVHAQFVTPIFPAGINNSAPQRFRQPDVLIYNHQTQHAKQSKLIFHLHLNAFRLTITDLPVRCEVPYP
jgi:hypothetical protein